jgi:predicted RNA-binding Zn-ribbon protein involved in translation (DUF1610 family)
MGLLECFQPMSTPVALRCSLCGGVLAPNEVREASACPRCGGIYKLDDSHEGNHKTPSGAGRRFPFAKKIYRALPKGLRVFISPVTYYFYGLLNSLKPQVWSVTGVVQGSQLPISVCLFTAKDQSRSYFSKLIFGPSARTRYLGRTWVWNTQKVPKAASDSSLVFSEIDAPYLKLLRGGCGIIIPAWVFGEAELPRSLRERQRQSAKDTLRKIRQHSLEFEISHDQRHFDDFYDNMYVAYIKQRHGGSAYVVPRKRVQKSFDKGDLLLVKKQGEYIAGIIITYEGSCACLLWLGVRDGNWDYVRDGAIVASYEFSLRHAEEKGCRKVKLYRSRAFLQDGPLRFKRKLSQRIVEPDHNKFLLRILSDSHATRAFLENTPFMFERFGELHGAVFVNGDTPLTLQALREINKEHFHAGMSKLVVFQFSPLTMAGESGFAAALSPELSANNSTDPSDSLRYKQLPRADWTDMIWGLGCTGIGQAVAVYPQDEDRTARLQAKEE